jgi:transcription antitermination factor NusA-like protein
VEEAIHWVKTALCSFCLKSGILCQKCSARVKSGEISEQDLKIARLLLSMEERYPSLQNVSFHRAVEAGRTLALIVGAGDVPRLLGYGGKIVKTLSEETGRSVRVLENGVDNRKFLEDLFAPLSILTINTIWLPDGTTETRAILRKRRGLGPPFDVEALKEIAAKVRNITLRVEFAD